MIFNVKHPDHQTGPDLQKNVHLQKQVEQVKTAPNTAATTQQNAVQACDPASFGPRRDVK